MRNARHQKKGLWLAAALLLVTLALAAGASAQLDEHLDVGKTLALDTDYTPVAKSQDLWKQVAGAKYEASEVMPGSVTDFDSDLFGASFRDPRRGFVGGSECAEEPAKPEDAQTCARVPVMYSYTQYKTGETVWERANLGPGSDRPGYVGAIAWIDKDRAVAVGGSGVYPRREPDLAPENAAYVDPAGAARAWLFEHGAWRELSEEAEELPAGVGGMTTLDFHPGAKPSFGAAGALGQIVEWRGNRFDRLLDKHSPESELYNHRLLRFRVRKLRFRPTGEPEALAVTAGCCSGNSLTDEPRVVAYGRQTSGQGQPTGSPAWYVRKFGTDATDSVDPERTRDSVNQTKWGPAGQGECRSWVGWAAPEACKDVPSYEDSLENHGLQAPAGTGDELYAARELDARQDAPDSFYSFTIASRGTSGGCMSALASAGGRETDGERASMITQRYTMAAIGGGGPAAVEPAPLVARTRLTTARLVASDGDTSASTAGPETLTTTGARDDCTGLLSVAPQGAAGAGTGDAFPDWSVGELRALETPGLGRRGLFLSTHLRPKLAGETIRTAPPDASELGSYELTSEEKLQRHLVSGYTLAPSYSLNGIEVLDEFGGVAWAVGDHGAILALGPAESAGGLGDPAPPRLGSREPSRLSDRSAYDQLGSPDAPVAPGVVPTFGEQPEQETPTHEFHRVGFTGGDHVSKIVMSRTGDEGWAIRPRSTWDPIGGLSHFNGREWVQCDRPAAEVLDAACRDSPRFSAPSGTVATGRVPMENDDEPANDDEFVVVLVADRKIYRYRDGQWAPESKDALSGVKQLSTGEPDIPAQPLSIAFTAPDDGWLLDSNRVRGGTDNPHIANPQRWLRFDGEQWSDCATDATLPTQADHCDPAARLPQRASAGQLTGAVAAGNRLYAFGSRALKIEGTSESLLGGPRTFPLILQRTRDSEWSADGGFDPGFAVDAELGINTATRFGRVDGLAVVRRDDGEYEGWASGLFGQGPLPQLPVRSPLLRLEPGRGWEPDSSASVGDYAGSADEQPGTAPPTVTTTSEQLALLSDNDTYPALMAQRGRGGEGTRVFQFDAARDHWQIAASARPALSSAFASSVPDGKLDALAADGRGGAWAAVGNYFFHFSDRRRRRLFGEVPSPERWVGREIRGLAAAAGGSLWARTNSDYLYRYERVTGWEKVRIPGWDRGRVAIVPSAVNAVALGPDGSGVAVGKEGRIARLSREDVALDAASGTVCRRGAVLPPCGTSRDLRAAAVASDGSALVGGESLSLLWRPPGGEFRTVERPEAASSTTITAIAMPQPDRAWLATDLGLVYAGRMSSPGVWRWEPENVDADGAPIGPTDADGVGVPLSAIAVGPTGRGWALGESGAETLERASDAEGGQWRRIRIDPHSQRASGGNRAFTSVAVAADGEGALIGGRDGLVLTYRDGRFQVARPADYAGSGSGPVGTGPVTSVALAPGLRDGQVEAWAYVAGARGSGRLLHYASDPEDPLLRPDHRAEPLPDVPPARPGDLSLAAFGKSDCQNIKEHRCLEMQGTTDYAEVVTRRIVDDIVRKSQSGGGPMLAVFTGDAVDSAAYPGNQLVDSSAGQRASAAAEPGFFPGIYARGPLKLRRFAELVADRLEQSEIPFLGAIGAQDLSETQVCDFAQSCRSTKEVAKAGENFAWRQAMALRAAPWGSGESTGVDGLRLEPVGESRLARRHSDVEAEGAGAGEAGYGLKAATGGASTHYAVDMVREGDERAALRLAFVDSSLGALSTADPIQQPLEPNGGQLRWLEGVLCEKPGRGPTGERCTREPGQPAVVVSNSPTYSYGPGFGTETAADGSVLESVLMRHRTSLVLSGRIGWNGLYWTTAPGVHEPCPGQEYQPGPPASERRVCGETAPDAAEAPPEITALADGISASAPASVRQAAGTVDDLTGLLPTVVASGAGGKFGAEGDAKDGFWHGYTIVRLPADGNPRGLVVEQRPVYDWVSIEAQDHTLRAGQRMTLRGFGRGPIGTQHTETGGVVNAPVLYDRIDGPAVTHRYDLLEADPEEPWLPRRDADGEYLLLDPTIATIDQQTGVVKAGKGRQERKYAIGLLSVGNKAATWPLVFEPAKSFKPRPALSATIRPPNVQPPSVQAPPPIQVLSQPPTQPPATPPPPGQLPTIGDLSLPAPPQLPTVGATPTAAPSPAPPPPPTPPPPPNSGTGLPLNLNAPISPISIVPTVIPPTPPPINPAPPGGSAARKEAKQRQAATAKSEEGASDQAGSVDTASEPPADAGAHMTRRDRIKPGASFTALSGHEQPSAWSRGALYGGGLGLAAVTAALGFTILRPRRRRTDLPAPALARNRRR